MVSYDKLSDVELTFLIKTADRNAYKELYERYWAILYHHARRLLQDEESAKDVVQDIFVMFESKTAGFQKNSVEAEVS